VRCGFLVGQGGKSWRRKEVEESRKKVDESINGPSPPAGALQATRRPHDVEGGVREPPLLAPSAVRLRGTMSPTPYNPTHSTCAGQSSRTWHPQPSSQRVPHHLTSNIVTAQAHHHHSVTAIYGISSPVRGRSNKGRPRLLTGMRSSNRTVGSPSVGQEHLHHMPPNEVFYFLRNS
jgi:hypothetical protein